MSKQVYRMPVISILAIYMLEAIVIFIVKVKFNFTINYHIPDNINLLISKIYGISRDQEIAGRSGSTERGFYCFRMKVAEKEVSITIV